MCFRKTHLYTCIIKQFIKIGFQLKHSDMVVIDRLRPKDMGSTCIVTSTSNIKLVCE